MFGFTSDDFYAVEIVGGSMRIPAFKIAAAQAVGVFKGNFLETMVTFFEIFLDTTTMVTFYFFGNFLDTTIHLMVETLISFFFF